MRYLHIGVWEVICASCNWRDTSSLKSCSQGLDMHLLIEGNVLKIVVIIRRVSCGHEILLRELLEGAFVEGILKMFELEE